MSNSEREELKNNVRSVIYGRDNESIYENAKTIARSEGYQFTETVNERAEELEMDLVPEAIIRLIDTYVENNFVPKNAKYADFIHKDEVESQKREAVIGELYKLPNSNIETKYRGSVNIILASDVVNRIAELQPTQQQGGE